MMMMADGGDQVERVLILFFAPNNNNNNNNAPEWVAHGARGADCVCVRPVFACACAAAK